MLLPLHTLPPQIFARDPDCELDDDDEAAFATVGPREYFRPLDFFGGGGGGGGGGDEDGGDTASAVVPFPWVQWGLNAPHMTVTVGMRLEYTGGYQIERSVSVQASPAGGASSRAAPAGDAKAAEAIRKVRCAL